MISRVFWVACASLAILMFWPASDLRSETARALVREENSEIRWERRRLRIGGKVILVEIADDDEKRARGLMFRDKLPDDQGMLFIFDSEDHRAFWMKNTLIPLSIGYFDADRRLLEVLEMVPAVAGEARPASYRSRRPAKYALEMPKGWFKKNHIAPGARFSVLSAP